MERGGRDREAREGRVEGGECSRMVIEAQALAAQAVIHAQALCLSAALCSYQSCQRKR